jgi:hypothetical protein
MKKFSWFAFFLLFFGSCLNDPDCYQLDNDFVGVTFRVMGTGKGDSVFVKNSKGVFEHKPSFLYQLNHFVEDARIDFEGKGGKTNFLSFEYDVKNQFISEDCGSAFVLSGLHVLGHDLDSARVINATPSKGSGTNIEIYRCPETDTLTIEFNQLVANSDGVIINGKTSHHASHQFESITTDFSGIVFTGRGTTINLPVDQTKNTTTFKFKTDEKEDSLVVRYNLVTEQRYKPCGIQTFVNELAIEEDKNHVKLHSFDSISFGLNENDEPARTLEDPHIANLRVFDCPSTNHMQVNFVSNGAPKSVTIKSITADHILGDLFKDYTNTTVTLPVDISSNASTFYIKYADDTLDTLSVAYVLTGLKLFHACPDPVINALTESPDLPNIRVLPSGTVLKFPTVPNVEITVN